MEYVIVNSIYCLIDYTIYSKQLQIQSNKILLFFLIIVIFNLINIFYEHFKYIRKQNPSTIHENYLKLLYHDNHALRLFKKSIIPIIIIIML